MRTFYRKLSGRFESTVCLTVSFFEDLKRKPFQHTGLTGSIATDSLMNVSMTNR